MSVSLPIIVSPSFQNRREFFDISLRPIYSTHIWNKWPKKVLGFQISVLARLCAWDRTDRLNHLLVQFRGANNVATYEQIYDLQEFSDHLQITFSVCHQPEFLTSSTLTTPNTNPILNFYRHPSCKTPHSTSDEGLIIESLRAMFTFAKLLACALA